MKKKSRTRWGLERGNIDLNDRPKVKNKDGSVSTVRSVGMKIKGKEVLLPSVSGFKKTDKAKIMSDRETKEQYAKTGKHLGKFRTPAQSNRYAETLHKMQEKQYTKRGVKK